MKPLALRDYQQQAITDLWQWFEAGRGNPLVVLPTGSGKSLVMAEWIRLMFEADAGARVIVLTHVRELVAQDYAELIGLWPDAPAGIYSAGLNRRDLHARILFASIQSVHNRAFDIQQCDAVIVDECHLIPRDSDTMYGKFLGNLKKINPALRIIGLTATPFRLDSGMLHEGKGAMFDGIAHETNVKDLIAAGYLAPPISWRAPAQIDTKGVGTRAGEFISAQLEHAALDPLTVAAIADTVVAAGEGRRGWIVFGCTVKHCEALAEALRERGVTVATIFGDTAKAERDRTIADFKAQRIRCLVSMGVLTTGFNAKHVDLIALARPTKSTGLYVQMVGRGTRCVGANIAESVANGKADCIVLDFGGNIARHGPFDEPFVPKAKGDGEGAAPFKECPECECACGTMTAVCPSCGYEFPPPERKVNAVAATAPILSTVVEWLPVTGVGYARHTKMGGPDTMRVDYQTGLARHSEWLAFDHHGYARTKAEAWWIRRGAAPVPRSVTEALERVGELVPTEAIRVKPAGRYTEIVAYKLRSPDAAEAA